jgi:hypothetical protein
VRIALDRLIADYDTEFVDEMIDLASAAVGVLEIAGRPLGAATAAMPEPDHPLTHLWHLASALRESRGDAHVAALVSHGAGGLESVLTSAGYSNLSLRFHRRARGWTDEEWEAGLERARSSGWIDSEGALTDAGCTLRDSIEADTDRGMRSVTAELGQSRMDRMSQGFDQLSARTIASGGFPG